MKPFSLSLSFNSPSFIWNYVSSYQTDELIYWKVKYTKNLIELIEDYFPFLEKSGLSLPVTSNVEVHFIYVGQGDSIYIKLPNNVDILIDGGNNWYGDDIVTYLNSQNVDDIEYLIATHPDADHIGGLVEFLKEVKPKYAVISVGKNNNYGHPAQEVLERLEMYKVDFFRTDLQGVIISISDGNKINFNVEPINTVNLMEDIQEAEPQKYSILITSLDVSDEKVTICNKTDEDVDLTGWVLVSEVGSQKFNFPDGYILKAGECVNILSGRNVIEEPPTNFKWTGAYIWNNDGDTAVLYDNEGTLISRVEL